jgi:hypothetical protein
MTLLSRRANVKRVEIEPPGGGAPLDVTVRGLRASEYIWAMDNSLEVDEAKAIAVFIRFVQLGLVEVRNEIDPDTGRAFELKYTSTKIGERSVQILTMDTIDAIMPYIVPLGNEIAGLTKLSIEERKAIPFTGTSSTPPGLAVVENAATGTNTDAKPSA